MRQGEIIEGRGGLYTVRDEAGHQEQLWMKRRFRRDGLTPLPGDRVRFSPGSGEEKGWVEEILPRRSLCLRPPVANIDCMVIVVAPEPQPDWLLVDKLLLHARLQDILPLICVNKVDLDRSSLELAKRLYAGAGADCLGISAFTGEGLTELEALLKGRFGCLAGQSGVGKSAVLSRLMQVELTSGAISDRIGRGRQTTRHTSLLYHKELKMLDTPGFSLLNPPEGLEPEALPQHYPEFRPFEAGCRFQPCLHMSEPGCAVIRAEEEGLIDAQRMANYREMMGLIRQAWKERYD